MQIKTDVKQLTILETYIADLLHDLHEQDESLIFADTNLLSPIDAEQQVEDIQESPLPTACRFHDNPFQCLVFSVGEVSLAAPLLDLQRVIRIQNMTPLFSQSNIFCGVMSCFGKHIRVVDTMRLLMPERFDPKMADQYNHVVVINSGDGTQPWGLAVTAIDASICVMPGQVRWRKTIQQYPWLMGTVLDRLCSLLNIAELDKLLTAYDKELPNSRLRSTT